MRLDKLKNAWQMLSASQNFDVITEAEILSIINTTSSDRVSYAVWQNLLLFVLLLLGCQGG